MLCFFGHTHTQKGIEYVMFFRTLSHTNTTGMEYVVFIFHTVTHTQKQKDRIL